MLDKYTSIFIYYFSYISETKGDKLQLNKNFIGGYIRMRPVWSVAITDNKVKILAYYECVKVPMPAHQVLPLTAYIFEASYSTSATQANKI